MIRVLVVDDEWTIRRGLRMQLELEPDVEVVGEAEDGEMALSLTPELCPDVVIMDVRMPGLDGIMAAEKLHQLCPHAAIVMLSLHDDVETRGRARAAGARAFIGKHEASAVLLPTIREVAATA